VVDVCSTGVLKQRRQNGSWGGLPRSSAFRTALVSGEQELVRELWVSMRDEARKLASQRLACADGPVPAEVPLCLLLTEAMEGHLAFEREC
jgi:hypothetical protein